MYLEHFGLREFPFSLTPDTHFFFEYGHYRDALATLLVALRSGEGFIKVTGEVGTGKTLLCRKLLNELDDGFYSAYIPNPLLTPLGLIQAFAEELGLQLVPNESQHRISKAITERLVQLHADGKKVVLLIDEAQAAPDRTLEALRLLTNLETEKRKLLQVVLFGQPELDERLEQHAIRQLRQRITFSYRLPPIDQEGVDAYVNHRLLMAGSNGGIRFAPGATGLLHRYSRGIPRLVNILAHKALMASFGQGQRRISEKHVRAAAVDTEDVEVGASKGNGLTMKLLAVLLVVALAALVWQFGLPLLAAG